VNQNLASFSTASVEDRRQQGLRISHNPRIQLCLDLSMLGHISNGSVARIAGLRIKPRNAEPRRYLHGVRVAKIVP
jgi:hypothetical protein